MSQSPARRRSGELTPPVDKNNPMETHSITFEWPLHDLKQHFDSSNSDSKSKVIKSVQFGQGRWTVLFYAQSGLQSFCSLYLNAEPTPEEKNQNKSPWDTFRAASSSATRSQSSLSDKPTISSEDGWTRQGLFRFTFKIMTLNKGTVLATKEACNHAFSHKTSNWGWAQFASRDTVFYANSEVQQSNAFLVSVTITASPERPRPLSLGVMVPPALIEAMGSLLDDPDHSDVVFVIRRRHRHPKTGALVTRERRIYAIKKILASRCEYFRDMFDSGFAEADATASSDEDADDDLRPAFAVSRGVGHDQRGHVNGARPSVSEDDDDELALEDSDEEMDVDEVYEMGRSNYNDQHKSSEGATTRSTLLGSASTPLKPAFGSTTMSASRRMRETSSDVPQLQGLALTQQPVAPSSAAAEPSSEQLQQTTPPQSRRRRGDDHDAGTDSGDDTTRAQGMSAFQTPQHSPRELRHDGSMFTSPSKAVASVSSHLRSSHPAHLQSATQNSSIGRILPQRRKSEDAVGSSAHSGKKRRKVVVRDAAYATYKALLYYLYTDTISFAPLHSHFYTSSTAAPDGQPGPLDQERESSGGTPLDSEEAMAGSLFPTRVEAGLSSARDDAESSTGGGFAKVRRRAHTLRQQVVDDFCSAHANVPAPCSAKSMYRLADKLQIPDLKKRAQEELAGNLTVNNIVWEAFSGFNSQFPAIRKMETDFLLKHWSEVKGTEVMKNIFSRPSAHPGLADIWPHLLSQLEFRGPSDEKPEASH